MDITYKIVGTDGQQYGPVTLDQLRGWINEGRLGADTQIWRSDTTDWRPAAQFSELGLAVETPPLLPQGAAPRPAASVPVPRLPGVPSVPSLAAGNVPVLEKRVKSGAGWFFWIAALSMVNSFSALAGSDHVFIIGLGVTQVFDAFGREMGGGGKAAALVMDVIVAGMFGAFGFFGLKRHTWSFIVGMVLYALDGCLCLIAGDVMLIAFHAVALLFIFVGLRANLQLKGLERGQA